MEQHFGEINGSYHYQTLLKSKDWRQGDMVSKMLVDSTAFAETTVSVLFEPKPTFLKDSGLIACSTTTMNIRVSSIVLSGVFNQGDDLVEIKTSQDGLRCGYVTPTTVENEIFSKTDLVAQVGIDLARTCDRKLPAHYLLD